MRPLLFLLLFGACAPPQEDLITASFVAPEDVSRISMFRSCCGHDYSRGEPNRSMKHYIHPLESFGVGDDAMPVYAPFDGTVFRVEADSRELPCFQDVHGQQIYIRPDAQRGVYVKLFHVNALVEEGEVVQAGQQVAWADVRECDSSDPSQVSTNPSSFDIALERADHPFPVFSAMTAEVWAQWAATDELSSPEDTVITEAERDADPCTDYWQECADDMIGLWGNEGYPPWW